MTFLVVCVSFGLFERSLERDVVEEFLSEVGRLESFTLFSRTFVDTVEEAFAITLRQKALFFSHFRFACS